jgi:colicin import membrane protein
MATTTGSTTPATARNTCKHPGCGELPAPAYGPGRPPEYCEGRGHTKVTAWRERRRLAAAEAGVITSPADTDSPVTMAKVTGAELLRAVRAEADSVSGIADRLRQAVETVADPTAAEAEVEAIRAAAEQRAAAAEARAAAAEQRAVEADQWRADAEAAGEEMAVQMDAAQACARQAEAAHAAAEADRDAMIEAIRQDATARIAAAEADRDAAIEQARAEASQRVRVAEVDRDQALARAAQAEQPTLLAQREAARARVAEQAARAETDRVRADAEKMLAGFRADAARDRDELRVDLRARAERAEHQATPTGTNSPSCAPGPATTPTSPPPAGRHGAPGKPPSRNSPHACGERRVVHPCQAVGGEVLVAILRLFAPAARRRRARPGGAP